MHAEPATPSPESIAADLLGAAIEAAAPTGKGGNSRVYKITTAGKAYALKHYPTIAGDTRDRFGAERAALEFFARHGLTHVPRFIAGDGRFALLSWVEGSLALPPQQADITPCLQFLGAVHTLRLQPDTKLFPLASQACLSGAELESQLDARLDALLSHRAQEKELDDFLHQHFIPAQGAIIAKAHADYHKAGLDYKSPLPEHQRSLIPADFGLHNALRQQDGSLVFIDFEYFGWDDPVKLAADFLLHPAMELTQDQRQTFAAGMAQIHQGDAQFTPRLEALLPCFALRWSLILLNEFLPQRLHARALARGETDLEKLKRAQLAKAQAMLELSHTLPFELSW